LAEFVGDFFFFRFFPYCPFDFGDQMEGHVTRGVLGVIVERKHSRTFRMNGVDEWPGSLSVNKNRAA
jgi:hypothetical protein